MPIINKFLWFPIFDLKSLYSFPSLDARYNKLKFNLVLNIFNIEFIFSSVKITVSANVDVFITLLCFSFSKEDNFSFNEFIFSKEDLFSVSVFSISVFNDFSWPSNSLYSFSNEENSLSNSVNSLLSVFSFFCDFNFSNCDFNSDDF